MIDPDKRNAVFTLHQEGMAAREISQRLNISRNTVGVIIEQQGQCLPKQRRDKIGVDLELLQRVYRECNGWVQRVHEKLKEEHNIAIGYSTLTRLLQQHGMGTGNSGRCDSVPDSPGDEMQHDTSVYQVSLGDHPINRTSAIRISMATSPSTAITSGYQELAARPSKSCTTPIA